MAFGFGGSSGSSQSSSTARGSTFVDPSQQGFLDFLRNTSMQAFGGFQQGQQQFAGQLGQLGQQAGQLGQQAQQNPFLGQLGQIAGVNPELLAQQQAQLGQDITQFTQQNLAMANRGAVGGGGLGGGRNQVARGVAIGQGADAFQRGSLGLQQQASNQRLGAAQAGGGLFGQGIQQGFQGLGLQGQFAGQGFQSQFAPLQALQGLFGAPTVLSQQQSQSQSQARNRSFQFNFGQGLFGAET